MGIQTDRFKFSHGEVRGITRGQSSYTGQDGKEVYNYWLELYLYDQGSALVDYDEDQAARDADYMRVTGLIS